MLVSYPFAEDERSSAPQAAISNLMFLCGISESHHHRILMLLRSLCVAVYNIVVCFYDGWTCDSATAATEPVGVDCVVYGRRGVTNLVKN